MNGNLRGRAYAVSTVWTLILLYLGSVVHATESSLACPDWPTCFGTMVPEMTGGVFWEHLHRLVAGGLLLMWGLATYLTFKETDRGHRARVATVVGMVLLLVQAGFGGLTVIMLLPDAISTAHLTMALLFLGLATALWVSTRPDWMASAGIPESFARSYRIGTGHLVVLVLLQSVLGAYVRHSDAGLACPDAPLCRGRLIPEMDSHLVGIHFGHRVLGILILLSTVWVGIRVLRSVDGQLVRRLAVAAMILVTTQVTLGFVSVLQMLAVIPVSLHSLVAALLLAVAVAMRVLGSGEGGITAAADIEGQPAEAGRDGVGER
jgi:heme A synthase